jgi:type VI secretion system protein ImpK
MTSPASSAAQKTRTNSVALAFQDVITVVLRTRFNVQRWDNADRMRAAVRQMIASEVQQVRSLGYSDETTQMALYAVVGFIDENVLNSNDPVFADWSRRPLSVELFGDQLAGEKLFRHVSELLNRPDSAEIADILELHCLCLLLGFRGRFAFGDASEIHAIIRRIREKIVRIRGPFAMVRQVDPPIVPKVSNRDRWVRNLSVASILLAVMCLAAYFGFLFSLKQSTDIAAQNTAKLGDSPLPMPISQQARLHL